MIFQILYSLISVFRSAHKYEQAERNIDLYNQHISGQIDNWFDLTESIESLNGELKNLGDEKAIEKEKEEIGLKIKQLKENAQLSDEDLKKYQKINADLVNHAGRINVIKTELLQISDVSEEQHFFYELKTTLSPSLANLPKGLKDAIEMFLKEKADGLLKEVNKQVLDYKITIEKEKSGFGKYCFRNYRRK